MKFPAGMEIMSKPSIFIIILFLATILGKTAYAQLIPTEPTYFWEICETDFGNYTANSTYENNLKSVLSSLQDHATSSAFYHTSAGSDAYEVHGQYYCRGDIDTQLCGACIQQAAETILRNCSDVKAGVIWYDVCTLRYRNESMYGVFSRKWISYGWSTANVSDPDTFALVLNSTLDRLINESAYGNDFNRFAVGEGAVSAFEKAYFLVQCSPDLNATECERCLWGVHDYIPKCCGMWPVRMRLFSETCQLRYSDVDFYYAPSPPPLVFSPPPPPLAFQPPPPPVASTPSTTTNGTRAGNSGRAMAEHAITGLAFLVLLLVNV